MNEYEEPNQNTTLNKKEKKEKKRESIHIKLYGKSGRYVVIDS